MDQDSNPQPLNLSELVCLHPKLQISAVDSSRQLLTEKVNCLKYTLLQAVFFLSK